MAIWIILISSLTLTVSLKQAKWHQTVSDRVPLFPCTVYRKGTDENSAQPEEGSLICPSCQPMIFIIFSKETCKFVLVARPRPVIGSCPSWHSSCHQVRGSTRFTDENWCKLAFSCNLRKLFSMWRHLKLIPNSVKIPLRHTRHYGVLRAPLKGLRYTAHRLFLTSRAFLHNSPLVCLPKQSSSITIASFKNHDQTMVPNDPLTSNAIR